MKKRLFILLLSAFLLSSCGTKNNGPSQPAVTNQPSENASDSEQTEEPNQTAEPKQEGSSGNGSPADSAAGNPSEEAAPQQSLSDKIAAEISYAGEQEKVVEKKQREADTQMEMNETAREMYQLWDDTLNAVWKLLEADLNEADMKVLRKEESEWIASKDAEVQAVGQECGGGSIQPSLEASTAAELTKVRVYELAKYAEKSAS